MVLSIVSCNCNGGAWLFLPVLVLLAPLGFSAVSHSSKTFLCLFFVSLSYKQNFPFSIFPHCF